MHQTRKLFFAPPGIVFDESSRSELASWLLRWLEKSLKAEVFLATKAQYKESYLTIRLRARDFYEVIVDESEARINYHFIEIKSE